MHHSAESALVILAGALLLDVLAGEYPRVLHPVVWLGKIISGLFSLAPARGFARQLLFGAVVAVGLVGASAAGAYIAMDLAAEIPYLHVALGIFLLKGSFALGALGRAADGVCRPLQRGDVDQARAGLRSLCSRDPSELNPEQLLEATIESLAENASDSFVAPLFYYLLLGVPGAVAYRAINTLDAMVGYRGRYEALGKASARLDDVVNWLPARLTAGLLLVAGWLGRQNVAGGLRVWHRDARKTPSPNGGRPMAVMAGLLGVRLEKTGTYALGDPIQPVTQAKARNAWRLVGGCAWLMAGLSGIGLWMGFMLV
jgi:adenosylcobinamide-phosphate synthase